MQRAHDARVPHPSSARRPVSIVCMADRQVPAFAGPLRKVQVRPQMNWTTSTILPSRHLLAPTQKFASPAEAGVHSSSAPEAEEWVPAFAGNAILRGAAFLRKHLGALPGSHHRRPDLHLRRDADLLGVRRQGLGAIGSRPLRIKSGHDVEEARFNLLETSFKPPSGAGG